MHNLTYKRMFLEDDTDIPQLKTIYQTPEIAQYISISDNYFRYVTNNENVYFYKVYDNNKLSGSIHLEKQGTVLYMDILVFPEFQRTGLGTKIVKDIQNDVFRLTYERIEISIDERNVASLRLFENAGFICTSKEDELINFVYQRRTDKGGTNMKPIKSGLIKKIATLATPLLLFVILLIPYSWVNQQFIVEWFGCGCPKLDEFGNTVYPDFNANDFTILYVVGIFAVSLLITHQFCQMMMWR